MTCIPFFYASGPSLSRCAGMPNRGRDHSSRPEPRDILARNFPREDDRKGPWLEDNRLRTNTKSGQTAAKTKVAGKEDPAGQAFPTEVPRKPSTGVKSSSSSATSQKNSHSRQLPSLAATVPEV